MATNGIVNRTTGYMINEGSRIISNIEVGVLYRCISFVLVVLIIMAFIARIFRIKYELSFRNGHVYSRKYIERKRKAKRVEREITEVEKAAYDKKDEIRARINIKNKGE